MTTKVTLMGWPRQFYQAGGGHPQLFYKVHGDLSKGIKLDPKKYRCAGIPAGVEVSTLARADAPEPFAFGLDAPFSDRLANDHPDVLRAARDSSHCLLLKGVIEDPNSLNYWRDTIGFLMCLLDQGGVAIFDPYKLDWWTPAEWSQQAFEPNGPEQRAHVVILVSDDEKNPGKYWIHTRGLIKFGRPDLSIRAVTDELVAPAEEVCNRFIDLSANGGVVNDGQPLKMASWPAGWACFHGGDFDDPDFNNVHMEIRPV